MALPIDVRPTASLGASQPILPLIGSGLPTRDGHGGRVPLLTQQLPSLDNGLWRLNADGTMMTTFRLQPGARWHDGTPITVDDFLFSLAVGRDREVPAFGAAAPTRISPQLANDAKYLATFPGYYVAPRPTDADGLRQYTSAQTPLPSNNFTVPGPVNASRYTTPELDDLVATYFRTIPITERAEVMGRIVRTLADQLAFLGIYYNVSVGARSNRLSGVGPMWAIAQFPWNAHQWDVQG